MQKTITKRAVDALKPGELIADDQLPGFVCRRLPSGRLTFGYRFTLDGKRRWLGIGVGIAPEAARKAAAKHAGGVAKDENPVTEREVRRSKALAARTVGDILDDFVKARVKGLRTESEVTSLLDRLVRPKIGSRPIDALRRLELVELLDTIAESKSARTADKVLSVLRTAFNWHATRDDTFRSPIVSGMARLTLKELSRDRILSDDEIRSLWSGLDACHPEAYTRLVRALLLSACRLNEMGGLQGSEIAGDVIVVPSERVKTKTEHVVPITTALAPLLGDGKGFRFSTDDGGSPFSGFSKAKRRLDVAINEERARDGLSALPNWRLHDLRRTARSLMGRAGVPTDHAERVLGHAPAGVRGVYDRHTYLAEKRDALERLAALVDTIIHPPTGNVVSIAGRR